MGKNESFVRAHNTQNKSGTFHFGKCRFFVFSNGRYYLSRLSYFECWLLYSGTIAFIFLTVSMSSYR